MTACWWRLSQPAKAIDYYRQVEDRFPDAKKSIAYFLRKAIRLPEVTVVRPGEEVELEFGYDDDFDDDADDDLGLMDL